MAQVRATIATRKRKAATAAPPPCAPRLRPRELFSVLDGFDPDAALKEMDELAKRYHEIQSKLESISKEVEIEKTKERAMHKLELALDDSRKALVHATTSHPFVKEQWGASTELYFSNTQQSVNHSSECIEKRIEAYRKKLETLAPVVKKLDDSIPDAIKPLPVGTCSVCIETILVKQPHVILPCSHLLCWTDYSRLPCVEHIQPDGHFLFERTCPECRAIIPRVEGSTWTETDRLREEYEPRSPSYSPLSDDDNDDYVQPPSPSYDPAIFDLTNFAQSQ